MPMLALHELAHAYHDQVIGFNDKKIKDMYKKAIESGKYKKVMEISGVKREHYAAINHKEYLSEGVEAFFGVNDYYPFTRPELKQYDQDLYHYIKKWAKFARNSHILELHSDFAKRFFPRNF